MYRRITALLWLRTQILKSNVNILIQVILPYAMLIMYKFVMKPEGMANRYIMFLCLSMAIAMSVGLTISIIIAEEKEKKNLKTLMLSGVKTSEYIISTIAYPIFFAILVTIAFPLTADVDLSGMYIQYTTVVLLTCLATILIYLCIAGISDTQSKAQVNSLPIMFIIALGPMFSQLNKSIGTFIQYTFLGAFNELTNGKFNFSNTSFVILLIWIIILFALTSFTIKTSKKIK
ncbi:ABC transporter permease [Actinomyces sp. zg-332]|uniref:ABC transporter permease n=1 Tax=Actinomyces sp. zg-332 TaxID=2708340 RepID=UPI00141F0D6F